MKTALKSNLMLAVLATMAGSATAQSSVTMYGIIDLGMSKMNGGTSNLTFWPYQLIGQSNVLTMRSSTSSRLGFRGTEDLGGGLKANFALEHRFAPDIGDLETAPGTVFWNSHTWVGLQGGFGEVRMGRQYVPAFYVGVGSDPWGYDFNVAGAAGFTRAGNAVSRVNNAVTYKSPNWSGLTSEVQIAAGEGTGAVPGQPGNGRNVGANLIYNQGPWWAGFGFNDLEQKTSNFKHRYWNVGVAYNFGFIRPNFLYSVGRNGTSNNEIKTMLVGATAPLGAGRLKAVVARYNAAAGVNANGANLIATGGSLPANTGGYDTTKLGLGYEHFLSKRTSLHIDIGTAKTQTFTRTTGVEAGIKHVF